MRKRKMCMIGGEADYALEAAKLRSRRLVYGKIGVTGGLHLSSICRV